MVQVASAAGKKWCRLVGAGVDSAERLPNELLVHECERVQGNAGLKGLGFGGLKILPGWGRR